MLDPEEPDYGQARNLGPEALPFLAEVIQGTDLLLAAKAVYLAARIGGRDALPVLDVAATHADASVRVAVAGGRGA